MFILAGYVFKRLTSPKKDPFERLRRNIPGNPRGYDLTQAAGHSANYPYHRSSNIPQNPNPRFWRNSQNLQQSMPTGNIVAQPYQGNGMETFGRAQMPIDVGKYRSMYYS